MLLVRNNMNVQGCPTLHLDINSSKRTALLLLFTVGFSTTRITHTEMCIILYGYDYIKDNDVNTLLF